MDQNEKSLLKVEAPLLRNWSFFIRKWSFFLTAIPGFNNNIDAPKQSNI
jgi:hypothetical protein